MLTNLVCNRILREGFEKVIECALPACKTRWLDIQNFSILSDEILKVDFWIIEAFSQVFDPSGFRLAYKMAWQSRCLLLFTYLPASFPKAGQFWCDLITSNFSEKLKEIANARMPDKADFEKLIALWPLLNFEPTNHHHLKR
ncbi:MAG: hypothetical protein HQ551_07075 [Desulfobacteraceae bacterium]|nr:hypothetical protein [Desulfobacteraceae bacterium]